MFQEQKDLPKPVIDSSNKGLSDPLKDLTNIPDAQDKIITQLQNATDTGEKFMDQPLLPNNQTIVNEKVWSSQPTSKIFNPEGIIENAIAGINRVVRLDIHIEGRPIKYFKHFKLSQSATKHHHFEMTLAHDTLGTAENHNLEEAQNFLGKRINIVFKYKDLEEGPERNFVGVITEVGFSQEKSSLGN